MRKNVTLACLVLAAKSSAAAAAVPLQTFHVKDYLAHPWRDELIHFDFSVPGTATGLELAGPDGKPVSYQFSNVATDAAHHRTTGKIWTVVTLEPGAKVSFQLKKSGGPATSAPASAPGVTARVAGGYVTLANDRMSIRLPQLPGTMSTPQDLTEMAAPIGSVRGPQGDWLGAAKWTNTGLPLLVRAAATTVIESGPVRCVVRQQYTFADGRTYSALIRLSARQDAALVTEDSDVDAPGASFRLDMNAGLQANRMLVNEQEASRFKPFHRWGKSTTDLSYDKDTEVAYLRPWTFWWLNDIVPWAGFYNTEKDAFVGVIATHPSRWTPIGWDGYQRTQIPVTAGPSNRVDLTFGLKAYTLKKSDNSVVSFAEAANVEGGTHTVGMHREWAITAGNTTENQVEDEPINTPHKPKPDDSQALKLRRQLLKYSEFPLDDVKDFGFDYVPAESGKHHPFLLFGPEDVQRFRSQVAASAALRGQFERLEKQFPIWAKTYNQFGEATFLNSVHSSVPQPFLFTYTAVVMDPSPTNAKMAAAIARDELDTLKDKFLDNPVQKPSLGSNGPWRAGEIVQAALDYDLLVDAGYFTPEQKERYRSELVFLEHWLTHPDYWDFKRGIATANPNMTSSIVLARGTVGLLLAGHPLDKEWVAGAEEEMKEEIKGLVSPGGAWREDPGYQSVSLDAIFMLAQGIKNVTGRDYFQDPNLKATMDYYGFLLTPPDRRFTPPVQDGPGPMVLPSIGDMFSGFVTPFNGWMANSTRVSDPAFSARQQFFWQAQGSFAFGSVSGDNSLGVSAYTTNPEILATVPAETSRSFPGFGTVMRTSWTAPDASYIAHRTGPNLHHYHDDFNSIVYYAKGVPLCLDFGNCYAPVDRNESWYHNRVSFDKGDSKLHYGSTGSVLNFQSLPTTVDYSVGLTQGFGGQVDRRYLLLVKSPDPQGANYTIMRDSTVDGQPNQQFYWNLWCLGKEPVVEGATAHFTGQYNVDLDVHILSPANPEFSTDHWSWTQGVYIRGVMTEEQYAIRIAKTGSKEDYLAVLYPRAKGQDAAEVTKLADGAALRVHHMEGTDVVLLSPGAPKSVVDGDVQLTGEVAYARRTQTGLRLAVLQGETSARIAAWGLASSGATSLQIAGKEVKGESSGAAHAASVEVPTDVHAVQVALDGKPYAAELLGQKLVVQLPEGDHHFTITCGP